ncbi:Ig-like domain-containing protein [Acetobacterium sp.]|uniref:Ig-like domain-containing protein n=1 Tax=Acetobacterium sp. TaxID=1872094 RepID=UPI002F424006
MKRKRILQPVLSLLLLFLLALSLCGSALAAGGDGSGGGGGNGTGGGQTPVADTPVVDTPAVTTTDPGAGDGTGGGKEEPLAMVSSNPATTANDILVGSTFTLEFNKNIAYVTVRDGNLKAFTLWEGSTQVPADVTMADDQLEPDLKNFVIITPKEDLKAGTSYTLKVDNTLVAKSGAVLAAPLELTYTTTTPAPGLFSTSNIILFIVLGIILIVAIVIIVRKRKKS